MRLIMVVCLAWVSSSVFAQPITREFGVVTPDVSEQAIGLVPAEIVEVLKERDGQLTIIRLDTESRDVVTVPSKLILRAKDFVPLSPGALSTTHRFEMVSASGDSGCELKLNANGTFESDYQCNCEDDRKVEGKLYRARQLIWAKGACNATFGFDNWVVFVLKSKNRLCYLDTEAPNTSSVGTMICE